MACLDAGERELHRLAKEDRAADAMYSLGIMYSTGDGVPMDYVEAHKWFNLSAMLGNADARGWRGQLAEEMRQTDIAEAQRQARSWLQDNKDDESDAA